MKRFFLLLLCAALFFSAGCGGGSSDYDKYGDDGDSGTHDDSGDTVPDKDEPDTSEDPSDTDTPQQPDEDPEIPDEEEPDDTDTDTNTHEGFWSTCEGIIACTNGCLEDDSECMNNCYGAGTEEGQLHYRRWRECFDNNCAEDRTAECSAGKCAEWDELCNVAEAFDFEITYPAPYGSAEFKGSFTFILNNSFPVSEDEITMSAFAEGSVASMQLASYSMMITFMRLVSDKRDGDALEVFQAPFNKNTMSPMNPVTILRIKKDSAVKGTHDAGVVDESEARFMVGEIDDKYNITCYHAFGIGTFTVDDADIQIGSSGKLRLSGGKVELFSPQNIPELGGDARETLGVEACSLIW